MTDELPPESAHPSESCRQCQEAEAEGYRTYDRSPHSYEEARRMLNEWHDAGHPDFNAS